MSNLPADWGHYYMTCEAHGKRFHASEGGCSTCRIEQDYLYGAECPSCGADASFIGVVHEEGDLYVECERCLHRSLTMHDTHELDGFEWRPVEDDDD
jgi:Zn ribbon nucleic-acid-binding protein